MPNSILCKSVFKYDSLDRLESISGPGKRHIVLSYNDRSQLQSVKYNSHCEEFAYNKNGNLSRVQDSTGTVDILSDAHGRPKEMRHSSGESLQYFRTEEGLISGVIWPDRHFLQYDRDLMGNIIRIKTPVGEFTFQHDYDNRIMQRTYPNDAFSRFEYNRQGRPVLIQHVSPAKIVVMEMRYTYAKGGLLAKAIERSQKGEIGIDYSYDKYGQLVRAEYSDGRVYAYEYDAFGNRTKAMSPGGSQTAVYDEYDRLTLLNWKAVSYDEAGNIVSCNGKSYLFNEKDELVEDGTCRYSYNTLGLRVTAEQWSGSQRYVHMQSGISRLFAETGPKTVLYLWDDGQCLGQINNGELLYFYEDHLGSIRCAMDISGNVIGTADYSPFGEPMSRIPGVRLGFAGEEQDEAGKVYLRARYYDPSIGRFLSGDKVLPQITDTIKQNRYAYAGNSPGNYVDRNGSYPSQFGTAFSSWIQQLWLYQIQVQQAQQFANAAYQNTSIQAPTPSSWNQPIANLLASNPHISVNVYNYENNPSSWNYSNNPPSYPVQSKGQILFGIYDSLMTTSHIIPNVFGVVVPAGQTPGFWNENGPLSNFSYNYVPIASYMALTHDAFVSHHNIDMLNPLFYGSMLSSVFWGSALFTVDHISGPEYASAFRGALYDMGRPPLPQPATITIASNGQPMIPLALWNKRNASIQQYIALKNQQDNSGINFPPPPPPGGGASPALASLAPQSLFQSPNVGGVYLDKAAEIIGDLTNIEGVTFDPVTSRIILIGKDASTTTLPPLCIEDLAAAFRTVFGDYDTEPGVTIDPNPKDPRAPQMIVRFFGGMENTRFGYILFEADRLMKALSLGEDNISHDKIAAHCEGYYNMLELGFSNLAGKYKKDLWSRFWLVPDQVHVQVSEDRKSISFPDTRIRVKTETMKWEKGKLVSAGGEKDEKAEYFAAHMSRYYDEYAKEFPVYQELKSLANIVGLVKWIKESDIPIDLEWLKMFNMPYETPSTTPSLTVSDERKWQEGSMIKGEIVSIFGGTDLKVENAYLKDDGKTSSTGSTALKSVAGIPGAGSAKFTDENNEPKKAVALPSSQTRAAGAQMLHENELGLIARSYCSFHNGPGPFGHSWSLDIPSLHITSPQRGKAEFITTSDQKVELKHFRISSPFGMQDVRFTKNIIDDSNGRICFVPDSACGIKALYPQDKDKELTYRIVRTDGSTEIFDRNGRFITRTAPNGIRIEYAYDDKGRLVKMVNLRNDKNVGKIEFRFDRTGRIERADTPDGKISYSYNDAGDLVKVQSPGGVTEYTYDPRHLVTEVKKDGQEVSKLQYDDLGRVVGRASDQKETSTTITQKEGAVEIASSYGDQKTVNRFDAGGRLLEAVDSGNNRTGVEYHDDGTVKKVARINRHGDTATTEYANKGRYVKATDPEGNVQAVLYDELGRVKQIQDDKSALVDKAYGRTDKGVLDQTETAEKTIQNIFTESDKPVQEVVTSKVPNGGQIMTEYKYGRDGALSEIATQGLAKSLKQYDKGMLKKVVNGKDETLLDYDKAGRVSRVQTPEDTCTVSYDKNGKASSIERKTGDAQET